MLILGTEILRLTSGGNQEGETSGRLSSVRLLHIRSGLSLQTSGTLQELLLLVTNTTSDDCVLTAQMRTVISGNDVTPRGYGCVTV